MCRINSRQRNVQDAYAASKSANRILLTLLILDCARFVCACSICWNEDRVARRCRARGLDATVGVRRVLIPTRGGLFLR